ncbi:hypothetical protein BFJ69_g15355 [Fusarium oxysporum]|uniref:Uncharacterized protein n=1 Tax=Fusarium oxysporum TaxID=5507 RepID=A0A420MEI3_FUSOX|nr:hypothetical protein BFJ69_g15355 [Fusarium oxysporum]
MANLQDYTVGWICALPTEFVAAQAFLDEEHERPRAVAQNDNNNYALGRIGNHNVVIAVLPDGEYGTTVAATVARDMLHSFPNIRIGLMVGIGGGAPSPNHDIRLGDIVVSSRDGGKGGVFQYDFGKTIQNHSFQETQVLDQPPTVLRAAVSALKAWYELKGHRLNEDVDMALKKINKRKKYSRPPASSDILYRSGITHPSNSSEGCSVVCGDDPCHVLARTERDEEDDNPAIHYGLIASANQLMKDALMRDKLAAEKGVLCFEMEAAGLMNHFPCLVIRGICDYSDSHKNKEWQGFAAMVAAAYAKDLLRQIPSNKVEAERRIGEILSGLQEIAKEHRDVAREHCDIAKEQLQAQRDLVKTKLSEEEEKCHQLFSLTTSSKNSTYKEYKERVEERVEGTCLWFLKHEHFQEWLKQDSGPLLVTADPGCGKSVLAKYLIDHGLPQSTTICYFFFKDQDQNTIRQALCALLHQLFSLKPSLIEHAMPQFRQDGQGLVNSTVSLWKVLRNAIDDAQTGPVIIVLDALDECAESEFADLMRNVESQFRSNQSGYGKLKYLLTCRPYEQIVSKFRGLLDAFPNVRIPGEEESETITQEVNYVITCRVNQLAMKKRLSTQIKSHLEKRLQETTHRTYLWVHLVFDYLGNEVFKMTPKGVESAIAILPRSINEAYDQILSKSKEDPMVRKALSIILAASRPLTLSEMNVAVNIDYTSQRIHDLDLEDDEDFKTRLRSWCGLFVSIHQGNIYFIHQTAREFLLANLASPTTVSSGLRWHHSITSQDAHTVLAEICVLYLTFLNSDASLPTGAKGEAGYSVHRHAFLDYSAKVWGAHFREADIRDDNAIVPFALRICDPDSKSYSTWFRMYWETTGMRTTEYFTNLMVASYYGHCAVVKLLLEKGADIEAKDTGYSRTPLLWAAEEGHKTIVQLLLEKGAAIEAKDKDSKTPLWLAAERGYETVVKLLIGTGKVNVDIQDSYGWTPLSRATDRGLETIVELLIRTGKVDVNIQDPDGWTPLSRATDRGLETIVELLIRTGKVDVNIQDPDGWTPLSRATDRGLETIVELLIGTGKVNVDIQDSYGWTPLSRAVDRGLETIVKLLLGTEKVDVDIRGSYNRTPLSWAAQRGHENIIRLLLNTGKVDINSKANDGRAPLLYAAMSGREAGVKLLLETKEVDIFTKDNNNQTPLLMAVDFESDIPRASPSRIRAVREANPPHPLADFASQLMVLEQQNKTRALEARRKDSMSQDATAIVALLLSTGKIHIDAQDRRGVTPFLRAAQGGHEPLVNLLLDTGKVDINIQDKKGRTPLSWAAEGGHEAIVELLCRRDNIIINASDNCGYTPLSYAAENGHEAIIKLLLGTGKVDINIQDKKGRTPLSWAAEGGHEAIVELLCKQGLD